MALAQIVKVGGEASAMPISNRNPQSVVTSRPSPPCCWQVLSAAFRRGGHAATAR